MFRNLFRDPEFPADGGRFAAKMRINQDGQSQISAAFGSDDAYGLPAHVHNIERKGGYLPMAEYFKSHPEYYAVIKGKRDGSTRSGQLCFTNPDLVPIFKAKLREYVKQSEAKAAARRGIPLYSMTNAGGLTWDVGVVPYEPAPYLWLVTMEKPATMPFDVPNMRNMMVPVEPTAARASGLTNLPTIRVSTML